MPEHTKSFGDKLLTLRTKRGFSQQSLADAVGVARETVSRWETGEFAPPRAVRLGLAAVLQCDPVELA